MTDGADAVNAAPSTWRAARLLEKVGLVVAEPLQVEPPKQASRID
jgi:hypothetical protein